MAEPRLGTSSVAGELHQKGRCSAHGAVAQHAELRPVEYDLFKYTHTHFSEVISGVTAPRLMTGPQVIVAIDAGGTTTRARAVRAGRVIHDGHGGPGNPMTGDTSRLRASYADALAGCPTPGRIVACVAGTRTTGAQDRVRQVLDELCPSADVMVVPDFVAAFHALPSGTDVCVIAGTGSLVCSRNGDGSWAVSGGKGWILGDHGSAVRLGQALLAWYVHGTDDVPQLRDSVHKVLGVQTREDVVGRVHGADQPSAVLASAAPILTRLAQEGHEFAQIILADEMDRLADTTSQHASLNFPGTVVSVGLVGGVWTSSVAVAAYRSALQRLTPDSTVTVAPPDAAIAGAVAFAVSLK